MFQFWIEKEHCTGRPSAGDGRPSADLEPAAWRAVQGHSGHFNLSPKAMGWQEITAAEARTLWHGTRHKATSDILAYGHIPGGMGSSQRTELYFSPADPR